MSTREPCTWLYVTARNEVPRFFYKNAPVISPWCIKISMVHNSFRDGFRRCCRVLKVWKLSQKSMKSLSQKFSPEMKALFKLLLFAMVVDSSKSSWWKRVSLSRALDLVYFRLLFSVVIVYCFLWFSYCSIWFQWFLLVDSMIWYWSVVHF